MEGYRDSTFSSIFSAEVDLVWECLLDISFPIFLQQCLHLMPFPPSPGAPTQTTHTHTHSHLISSTLPKCGNFRHPIRLMGERLLSKLSQHATNTPAPFTYLEVALTFIRGISHKLYPSKAQIEASSRVQQRQPTTAFGKLDSSSCQNASIGLQNKNTHKTLTNPAQSHFKAQMLPLLESSDLLV